MARRTRRDERARAALAQRRPRRLRRAAALRALRRPAAARRRRARAGARAAGAAVRRAAVESRRAAAPADARGDPRPAAAAGLTVVYVTHDQAEAMAVSDRIIVMNNGGDRAGRRAARALRAAARRRSSPASWATPIACAASSRVATRALGDVALGARDARRCRIAACRTAKSSCRSAPRRSRLRAAARRAAAGTVRKAAYLGGVMEYTLDTAHRRAVRGLHGRRPAARRSATRVGVALANHGVVVIPPEIR